MYRAQMSTSKTSRSAAAAPKQKVAEASGAAKGKRGGKSAEAVLARIESVRLAQRQEDHFDCFAKAKDGYCDQSGCAYHADCLSISQRL